jgi:hypothetical protein
MNKQPTENKDRTIDVYITVNFGISTTRAGGRFSILRSAGWRSDIVIANENVDVVALCGDM